MFEFFYAEFESLRAKTGIRQWEQLNEQPDAAKVIHDVIDFMCQECEKPPFNVVRPEVKQRVISRAIVEDSDFIGLNAKFVRRALNAWWLTNGDRVIEAMNAKEAAVYERVELTPEQKAKIDALANQYVAELLQGDGMKQIPNISGEAAMKEGAEWKSELERKAVSVTYKRPPDNYFETKDRIRRAASEFYKDRHSYSKMQIWTIDGHDIFAETEADALTIYNKAR